MERGKTTGSETSGTADGEASSKNKDKTLPSQRSVRVPAEILANEKKKDEKEQKGKKKGPAKSKSSPKKNKSAKAVKKTEPKGKSKPAEKVEKQKGADRLKAKEHEETSGVSDTGEATPQNEAAIEDKGRSTSSTASGPEASETPANNIETEPYDEEVIITPRETSEEEGVLYLSEQWRNRFAEAEEQSTAERDAEVSVDSAEAEEDVREDVPPPAVESTDGEVSQNAHSSDTQPEPPLPSPPIPPVSTRRAATPPPTPPVPPRRPSGAGAGNQPPVVPEFAAVASGATSPERIVYRDRRAEGRALITGLLIGGVIEHVRHRRREKRAKRAHKKEIKQLKTNEKLLQQNQQETEKATARTKTALENQIERLQKNAPQNTANKKTAVPTRAETAPLPPKAAPAETPRQESKPKTLNPNQAPSSFYEEFKRKYHAPEAPPTPSTRNAQEQIKPKTAEQPAPAPRQPENIDQPVELPPDRRMESSAWHHIEVDKKTGKAVENPTVAYGEEFKNEQHQEQLRQQIAEASIESEQVKQAYMPIIDKTADTSVEMHDTPRPASRPQKPQGPASLSDTVQSFREKAADTNGVDILLWVVFFFIVVAIIIAL